MRKSIPHISFTKGSSAINFAPVLVMIMIFLSTGLRPDSLDYLNDGTVDTTENMACQSDGEEEGKENNETDDFSQSVMWQEESLSLMPLAYENSHFHCQVVYYEIFSPPPELG